MWTRVKEKKQLLRGISWPEDPFTSTIMENFLANIVLLPFPVKKKNSSRDTEMPVKGRDMGFHLKQGYVLGTKVKVKNNFFTYKVLP